MNKKYLKNTILLVFCLSILNLPEIFAQINSIPPSVLGQFENMSPEQQRRVAQRYGVDIKMLDSFGADTSEGLSELGNQADELETIDDERLYQRLLQERQYEEQQEKYDEDKTFIFEREYNEATKLPIYGQFLFDNEVTTYAPVDNAPIPDSYRIGVGDSLNVLLYGNENLEQELIVDRNGDINFPSLGNLSVAGMSFDEIREYINSRVKDQMIGVNIAISIGRLRSINVFMAGEAKVPGNYSVSALSTISQLLFSAGGVSEIGSLRNIQLIQSGKVISKFDTYKLLTQGKTEGDLRLQSGDVVFIPPIKNSAIIDGAVNRPGRYELIEEETVNDLILLAGGLKSRASTQRIQLERYNPGDAFPVIINLDLSDNDQFNHTLQDGDVLRIASVSNQSGNTIILQGAVQRPGKYGWYQGIKLTTIIKSFNEDLLPESDTLRALIVRRKSNNTPDIETISFNLLEAINNPGSASDIPLESYDKVIVFSQPDESEEEIIAKSLGQDDIAMVSENLDRSLNGQTRSLNSSNPNINNSSVNQTMGIQQQTNNTNIQQPINYSDIDNEELRDYIELQRKQYSEKKERERLSRKNLLEPILEQLRKQANSEEPLQIVSISGAVKAPGNYPLTINATFLDLIYLAGGLADDALEDKVELRRINISPSGPAVVDLSEVDLQKVGDAPFLQSRDHIRVQNIKDWNIRDSVELQGEVFYPGEYLIGPDEKLSSVIERAGGFTSESFINAALFTRETIKEKEREQLLILSDSIRRDQVSRSMTKESEDFPITSQEVEAGIEALLSTEVVGRLIIDLPRLLNGDQSADLVLQDGDVLAIPKYTNAVTVVGEVRRSGSFVRQETYTIDDYLELAAGLTARGNKKEIYVIRANGAVDKVNSLSSRFLEFGDSGSSILAGDTIVVPLKLSYQTPLNLYQTVSQVIFQSIASIAAFSTIFN